MVNFIDFYRILNVSYYATFEEIKEAYRAKVKETHPDSKNGNAESFKLVKEAYEVLSNEEKRRRYNEFLFNHTKVNTPVSKIKMESVPPKANSNNNVKNLKQQNLNPFTKLSLAFNVVLIGLVLWGYNQLIDQKHHTNIAQEKMKKSVNSLSKLKEQYKLLNDKYASLETEYNNFVEQTNSDNTYVNDPLASLDPGVTVEQAENEVEYINPEGAFTQGSSRDHVKLIMGTPSSLSSHPFGGETWWYGSSAYVEFNKEGVVEGWTDINGDTLKVQ
jgi:curved DNA-binding protein CbpA